MPIREESPPPDAVDVATSALGTTVSRLAPGAAMGGAAVAELRTAYRVFVTGLQDVLKDRLLEGAKPVGWQFLVTAGGAPVAAIEVPAETSPQESRAFNHVNRGPYVQSTDAAVRRIGNRPDVINGSLRVLRVPALYTVCLWLHGDNVDELLPVPPTPRGVDPDHLYSESELTERLIGLARERETSSASAEALRDGGAASRRDGLKAP
jgi:hypothetical protein